MNKDFKQCIQIRPTPPSGATNLMLFVTSTNAGVDPIGVAGFQSARVWCKSKVMTKQFDKTLVLLVNGLPYLRGAPPDCLSKKGKCGWTPGLTLVSLKPMRLSGSGKHGTPRRSLEVESFFLLYQDLGWHMNKSIMKIANHQPGRS